MYKITVPVMNENLKRCGLERTLEELKRLDAERVLLALDTYETDPEKRKEMVEELADNCRFMKAHGYEVGTWFWTFLLKDNKEFRNMRSLSGKEIPETMCPTDDKFVAFAAEYVKELATTGVDLILFDDDFRYGILSDTPACLCDGHIEAINRITGEQADLEEISRQIQTGGRNKVRDAYLQANGDAFRRFAAAIRAAVDEVNPDIRIGACACMTSWDIDGTDAYELAKLLAGNTKPFVRLIGAPYWAVRRNWGNCVQDVVELERMESVWTRKGEIEIWAEGDAWPRPRYNCPSSYLESFDMAIRAAGCTDGILKYGLDYHTNADYETGYAKAHERNSENYKGIQELFSDKESCGVRVYESMKKVADLVVPTKVNDRADLEDLFFSKAARTLSHNAIPSVYEGEGVCGIVFGENARNLPLTALKKGLILDIAAAEILTERGVDVGLLAIGDCAQDGSEEHFFYNNNCHLAQAEMVYDITLKASAEILSDMKTSKGVFPVSYRYENPDGNRFLVLNLNTRFGKLGLMKTYERSRQYAEQIPWLSGEKLPAYVYGHPSLYMQCKKKDTAMAVGLWNLFADIAVEPVVELAEVYSEIRFLNCSGRLDGDKVYLSDIPAFGFAAFEVVK